jgi:prephenate dehydratase
MFYADIVGAPGDPAVDRALEELAFHCKELRMLGSYPQAWPRGSNPACAPARAMPPPA